MQINTREDNNIIILDLAGEIRIDEPSDVSLKKAVKNEIEKGNKYILLNFKDLEFIDSSGIGEIVSSFVSVQISGGKLKIMNVPEKIKLILKYTNLTNVIEIFDSEEVALKNFY